MHSPICALCLVMWVLKNLLKIMVLLYGVVVLSWLCYNVEYLRHYVFRAVRWFRLCAVLYGNSLIPITTFNYLTLHYSVCHHRTVICEVFKLLWDEHKFSSFWFMLMVGKWYSQHFEVHQLLYWATNDGMSQDKWLF